MALHRVNLTEWIKSADAKSLAERVKRMRFLRRLYDRDSGFLFYGGSIPARAFEEMQFCYIHGAFISCILSAQVVIEHSLAALLELSGRDDINGVGLRRLCEEALKEKIICQNEFDKIDSLRKIRNPYTHSKPFMCNSCIVRQSASTLKSPGELFKEDAEKALAAVINLFSRTPFSI